jgi:tetratricopeptide (TPR) repeat protein
MMRTLSVLTAVVLLSEIAVAQVNISPGRMPVQVGAGWRGPQSGGALANRPGIITSRPSIQVAVPQTRPTYRPNTGGILGGRPLELPSAFGASPDNASLGYRPNQGYVPQTYSQYNPGNYYQSNPGNYYQSNPGNYYQYNSYYRNNPSLYAQQSQGWYNSPNHSNYISGNGIANNVTVYYGNGQYGYGYGNGYGFPTIGYPQQYRNDWYHGSWHGLDTWSIGNPSVIGIGRTYGYRPGNWLTSGYYSPVYSWGTWGLNNWGLGSLATNYYMSSYVNPYFNVSLLGSTYTGSSPTVSLGFDYSKPIVPTARTPETTAAEMGLKTFEAARKAFTLGSYEEALQLANQTLNRLPNDTTLHEFRALCLFALKRYEEAALTLHPVLSAGPGWDWTTLSGLYPSTDIYTQQLRDLENFCRAHLDLPGPLFVLGYHYLVQGNKDSAGRMFRRTAALRKDDKVSAQLAKALAPAEALPPPSPVEPGPGTQDAGKPGSGTQTDLLPERRLVGAWATDPNDGVSISFVMDRQGKFQWKALGSEPDNSLQLSGKGGVDGTGVLVLLPEQGQPLAGKIEFEGDRAFTFQPIDSANAPRLTFRKR